MTKPEGKRVNRRIARRRGLKMGPNAKLDSKKDFANRVYKKPPALGWLIERRGSDV